MMYYASIPVFLSTGGLTSHTGSYGHGGVLSGTGRKQVFWKGQKAGFLERPESRFSGKARKQVFQTPEG